MKKGLNIWKGDCIACVLKLACIACVLEFLKHLALTACTKTTDSS